MGLLAKGGFLPDVRRVRGADNSAMGCCMSVQDAAKKAAAEAALRHVPEQGVVGLGSGSTAKYFIEGVGRLVASGRQLVGVPTSESSRALATELGIKLASDDGPWTIDLTVDGADEVSANLDLIKGGGCAHTREKIVNQASKKNVIVVDESKLSEQLGEKWAVPLEVLSFAYQNTVAALAAFGRATLRKSGQDPVRSDAGNVIVDLHCGVIESPSELDARLRTLPGVVETGLFCGRADIVLVASQSGVRELKRTS